ncbi:hypothetical protein [Oscillibacter sp. KLE 1728]|uniref:hypothetical protein n=1 Tax=Oscillibacter sp. KLE 1728 TaxID=1226322 RepID=UPI002583E194|nr:hypothetical protein [Oscillibacter sp. KLE 1728]
MSTREDVKTFFGLPLDFSMLELEPETGADPVRYFCTPENAEIIGWGSCGTHFVLLPGDEAVYCVEPELAEEGTFVLPVGADFREFVSHLLYCKCTSPLAQIFMLDATRFRKLLEDNDANTWPGCEEDFKSGDASLALLAETFHIRSRDPFQRVKELQTGFDPSVLNFSDAYYDTLGLEKPKRGMQRKEKPLFEFPPITFDLYQEDDP